MSYHYTFIGDGYYNKKKKPKIGLLPIFFSKTMVHLHNGILLRHKIGRTLGPAQMDLESIMLSEINQSEKDKYHDFSHMYNLMNKIETGL